MGTKTLHLFHFYTAFRHPVNLVDPVEKKELEGRTGCMRIGPCRPADQPGEKHIEERNPVNPVGRWGATGSGTWFFRRVRHTRPTWVSPRARKPCALHQVPLQLHPGRCAGLTSRNIHSINTMSQVIGGGCYERRPDQDRR